MICSFSGETTYHVHAPRFVLHIRFLNRISLQLLLTRHAERAQKVVPSSS
jgi:hypothetical protein